MFSVKGKKIEHWGSLLMINVSGEKNLDEQGQTSVAFEGWQKCYEVFWQVTQHLVPCQRLMPVAQGTLPLQVNFYWRPKKS